MVRGLDIALGGLQCAPGLGDGLSDGPAGGLDSKPIRIVPLDRGAHPRQGLPTREEGHGYNRSPRKGAGIGVCVQRAGQAVVAKLALQGDGGHLLGPGASDPGPARLLGILRAANDRASVLGQVPGLLDGAGHKATDRRLRREVAGRLTDDRLVVGAGGGEDGLRGVEQGDGPRKPGLGLGNVGPGNLAHLEPRPGLVELALEDGDIRLANAEGFLVAADIHVELDDLAQDLGLGAPEGFAPGQDVSFRGRHGRGHTPARVDRLVQGEDGGARVALNILEGIGAGYGRLSPGRAARHRKGGPVAGTGLVPVLVQGPQLGALGL